MAGFPPDFSNSGFRYYSKPFDTNKGVQSFTVLYDDSLVWYNGVTLTTGGWRPARPSDFAANISVSGLNLSVGAVSITGNPQVQISNTPGVTVQNPVAVTGGAITVSSLPNVTVGNAVVPVSGNIRVLGGGALNVAVTGGVLSTSSSATAVTGNVSVIVGNPISVTGLTVNSTVNTVAVTGNPQVTISNPIAVTGLTVNTTVNTVAITGSPNVTVVGTVTAIDPDSRALLSGISGSLASNLSDPAWVTGQISITNPIAVTGLTVNTTVNTVAVTGSPSVTIANPIAVTGLTVNTTVNTVAITGNPQITISNGVVPVSGVVTAGVSNPIGVTGTTLDVALPSFGGTIPRFLPVGGRVVNVTGAGSITGYNSTGDFAVLNFNRQNGGLLVNQGALDRTQDEVTIYFANTGTASSNTVSGINNVGWGTPLGNNPNRKAWGITNLSTGVLFVRMGTLVNSGNAHFVLKGGSTGMDGNGGQHIDRPAVWTGPVSVTGYFVDTPAYSAWEL